MSILDSFHQLMDAETWLQSFGPWVLWGMGLIVFIESGLLFPFLPGDSLLITAAMLHGPLNVSIWQILLVSGCAAVAGDQAGFYLGHRFGRKLFKKDAKLLKLERLEKAEEFFHRRGPLALIIGRFIPIIRTYVPLAAGTAGMHYRHFAVWNVTGAVAWVGSMVAIGYFLGGIPNIASSIEGITIGVVIASLIPIAGGALIEWIRAKRQNSQKDI